VLSALGVDAEGVSHELRAMSEVRLGRTVDRSVLGSLNDYVRLLDWEDRDLTPLQVSVRLSETPCIAMDLFPDAATRMLLKSHSKPAPH
jgi:hypothetical protein